MKNINEIMLNPIRMRIIQELASNQSITATELCKKISNVPRTTMYRHINILIDNDILSVVSEKKIRGSLERTLALNIPNVTKHNTIENADQNAFGFLMCNYAKFHNYFSDKNSDPAKDKIFLNNTVLMMNDTEFDQFLAEIREILVKYSFESAEGRKVRDISIISSPS
ncbi:helix-turn-helix domain-containing protein [Abyssisolibacter fermentans]|uniref:helix-turn-helix domain-containing protein n=1 Tax=Abyssisolibacter fermentans TaxID=1766203 RepID=UPI00082EF0DE|nr:helix-turn-helix domain-containing protein [Abyssisolibacter fermentans]